MPGRTKLPAAQGFGLSAAVSGQHRGRCNLPARGPVPPSIQGPGPWSCPGGAILRAQRFRVAMTSFTGRRFPVQLITRGPSTNLNSKPSSL